MFLKAPIRHPPDDRLVGLRLPPLAGIGKSGPSRPKANRGCLATKAGDASAFRARDADFVFIKTHLSPWFSLIRMTTAPFMPALDQAAAQPSNMWWQGPKPGMPSVSRMELVQVRPKPVPITLRVFFTFHNRGLRW